MGGTMRMSPEGALDVRTATSAVTGGVKVGDSLVMSDGGVLNARIDDRVNEGSERPASSKAVAAWLKGKNYVSESTLNGRGYVSEGRLGEVMGGFQPRMGVKDIVAVSQEQFEAIGRKDAETFYLIY